MRFKVYGTEIRISPILLSIMISFCPLQVDGDNCEIEDLRQEDRESRERIEVQESQSIQHLPLLDHEIYEFTCILARIYMYPLHMTWNCFFDERNLLA